tara:strand:+ start:722 stop:835 length:114 start_codon:yes stop_codon:yes gene_type:complete
MFDYFEFFEDLLLTNPKTPQTPKKKYLIILSFFENCY